MRNPLATIRHFARRFRTDRNGAAAVEFALLLPLFLVIYLCVIEFTQAFMVQRRAHHSASMMADIVSQSGSVSRAQLADYFAVGGLIMAPYSSTPLEGRVTSIQRDSRNRDIVMWSYGSTLAPHTPGTQMTVPDGLLEKPTDSVIYAETVYRYDSPFDIVVPGFKDFLSGVTTFHRVFYLRPREVASVTCTDCPTR
ncbi:MULTISPECIES: TadE/TadG family type IV pilus assembly protein [unclassified Brevundimonas]|uniref:TadE/TadG family type IV pilus assembly protein n=1 Tax=unclassified Brevundimonas TaxID=2622653 RepID=UPI0025C31CE0|nr:MULTISPECIES: TadE/TadG family type IV pilus assembly protein [unclassified Brevundimonas]